MVGDHERFHDDVGAYLLGALPADDEARLEAHLDICEECRDDVERLRVAVDALPRSVEPIEPPPALKRSVMEAVRAEPIAVEALGPGAAAQPPRRTLAARLALDRVAGGFTPRLAGMAAAAVLVAGGLIGYGISQLASSGGGQRIVSAQVDRARVPRASASLVIPNGNSSVSQLRVSGLPSPGPGQIYEVWVRRGNQVERAGLFSVGADGSGTAGISQSLDGVNAVMVTREEAPLGAPAPTGQPLITVRL